MDAFAWAHEPFWGASLPDVRLRRRLVDVAASIRLNPRGTLPQALEDPAALKGAYRFLKHAKVKHDAILEPHVARTRQACAQPGEYLLIEDTTALSFTHRDAVSGMGPLTHEGSQGLLVHTCLAARIEHWGAKRGPEVTLAGVFGQECWARAKPEGTRVQRKKAKRKSADTASSPRESRIDGAVRWSVRTARPRAPNGRSWRTASATFSR